MSSAQLETSAAGTRTDTPAATRSMRAIATTAVVAVTAPHRADEALALLAGQLAAIDQACSRFRDDSELRRVEERSAGRPIGVTPLLFEALEVACVVAVQTAGIVDPTIGSALVELGYDRDFEGMCRDLHKSKLKISALFNTAGRTDGRQWTIRPILTAQSMLLPEFVMNRDGFSA